MSRVDEQLAPTAGSTQPQIAIPTRRELRESRPGRFSRKADTPQAGRPAKPRRNTNAPRNPFTTAMVMFVTGGMFLAVGLPAYAETDDAANDTLLADGSEGIPQSLVVGELALASAAAREQFGATTHEELELARRAALMAARAPGPKQAGDDYPWREADTTSLSPLRYVYRQCVDFVVWRLNRDAGASSAPFKYDWGNLTPGGGDARQWFGQWQRNGWTYSNTPIVGSVAYIGANHLAYVKEVYPDGQVFLEEYNYVPDVYSTRIAPSSAVTIFLYPPPF